jgi:hypothetical protein
VVRSDLSRAKYGDACFVSHPTPPSSPFVQTPVGPAYKELRKRQQWSAGCSSERVRDAWRAAPPAPFAAGNRLFIRTFNALYCFGDKERPFSLGKAFDAK